MLGNMISDVSGILGLDRDGGNTLDLLLLRKAPMLTVRDSTTRTWMVTRTEEEVTLTEVTWEETSRSDYSRRGFVRVSDRGWNVSDARGCCFSIDSV